MNIFNISLAAQDDQSNSTLVSGNQTAYGTGHGTSNTTGEGAGSGTGNRSGTGPGMGSGRPPFPPCPKMPYLSEQLFPLLSTTELVLIGFCALLCLLLLLSYVKRSFFVYRTYSQHKVIRNQTLMLLAIFPVVGLSALFSICFPRATLICSFLQSIYIARSMFTFVTMIMRYLDGPSGMESHLREHRIVLQAPPLCCCLCCLPKVKVNRRNIFVLRMLILQYAVLTPIVSFLSLMLFFDGRYQPGKMSADSSFAYLNTISTVSSMLGLWSYIMFFRLVKDSLKHIKIGLKFFSMQFVILFVNLQGVIFSILMGFDIPACAGRLSTNIRGNMYNNMLLVLEMFLLSILARIAYNDPPEILPASMDLPPVDEENKGSNKIFVPNDVKGNGHDNSTVLKEPKNIVVISPDRKPLMGREQETPGRNSFIHLDPADVMALADARESNI